MRPVWQGALCFCLVNIPLKMHSATESSALDFDMLDKSNIKNRRVNETTGKEVAWKDIVTLDTYKKNSNFLSTPVPDVRGRYPGRQLRRGQTLASVYSARPVSGANVSTPLEWKEVKKGLHPSRFTTKNIGRRLQNKGDFFCGVLGKGLDMEKCLEQLGVSR